METCPTTSGLLNHLRIRARTRAGYYPKREHGKDILAMKKSLMSRENKRTDMACLKVGEACSWKERGWDPVLKEIIYWKM
jgi:hypothetical protein